MAPTKSAALLRPPPAASRHRRSRDLRRPRRGPAGAPPHLRPPAAVEPPQPTSPAAPGGAPPQQHRCGSAVAFTCPRSHLLPIPSSPLSPHPTVTTTTGQQRDTVSRVPRPSPRRLLRRRAPHQHCQLHCARREAPCRNLKSGQRHAGTTDFSSP